jgi:hypothetical protein
MKPRRFTTMPVGHARPSGFVLPVVTAVAVLALTAACGSEESSPQAGTDTASTHTSSGTTSTSAGDGETQAVQVVLRRTGGLRPTQLTLVYAADTPPPGNATEADVHDVLAAASNPALHDADMTRVPKNTCCDRQFYSVTITYADGSTRTFSTLDGLQQPKVFERLLSMLG